MNGRYNKFFRTGGSNNTQLETIYNDLKQSIGTAYNTEEDDNLINIDLFCEAKELDAKFDFTTYMINQTIPLKIDVNQLSAVEQKYNIYNNSNSDSTIRRKKIDIFQKTYKNTITYGSLYDNLKLLAPNTFNNIFLFHAASTDYSKMFGIDYILQSVNGVPFYPLRPIDEDTVILDSDVTGGLDLIYKYGTTSKWWTSLFKIGILIHTTNQYSAEFQQELFDMKEYLTKFLPAHLDFVFFKDLGFQIEVSKLDGFEQALS